ncbi:MAG TPA: PEP-CTERM sorting domain-containing protein [Methylomirabilota bacterium]|nr:PEP-CTERM sorting domain-containing protein [Methylomirabilota bacterium]
MTFEEASAQPPEANILLGMSEMSSVFPAIGGAPDPPIMGIVNGVNVPGFVLTAIPEPSTVMLFGVSALAFAFHLWSRRRE